MESLGGMQKMVEITNVLSTGGGDCPGKFCPGEILPEKIMSRPAGMGKI